MAAAQATPQAAGDGLVVDSAETSVNIVSSIAAPPADSSTDMVPHTGQFNNYDPILGEQFIATANITWSTSQLPGTLLWSTRIHPDNCNQFIKHISQMYNAWAGSLDFRLKIAGTGFHAGALMVVRLPPNINPTDLTSLSDVTAFEYALVDPKQLSVVDRTIMDQRNILYHYRNNLDPNDPNSFGGYFAVYVAMQLNTSSSGLNQINVQLWTRAGPDLVFSQLRPINKDPSSVGIDLFKLYFGETGTCAFTGEPVVMSVQPSTQLVTTFAQSVYRIALSGVEASGLPIRAFQNYAKLKYNITYYFSAEPKIFRMEGNPLNYEDSNDAPLWPYEHYWHGSIQGNPNTTAVYNPQGYFELFYLGLGTSTNTTTQAVTRYYQSDIGTAIVDGGVLATNYPDSDATVQTSISTIRGNVTFRDAVPANYPYAVTEFSPPINESLVFFGPRTGYFNGKILRPQTIEIASAAMRGLFKNIINDDQVVFFEMKDRATNLPILYLKLYTTGVLTTKATSTITLYNYENYEFVPLFIAPAISPFPTSAEHAKNRYIAMKENGDRRRNKVPRSRG